MKKILFIVLALMFVGCGGSSVTITGQDQGGGEGGDQEQQGRSFSGSSDPITIDDIVNGSASAMVAGRAVTVSADAAYYYGRFYYTTDYVDIYTGSIKFKIKKYSNTAAYFSDATLEHFGRVSDFDAHVDIVNSSTDLMVDGQYDVSNNHVQIADATERFVGFDVDFGNNDYFGDITYGGVLFSTDFTTMVGGNNATFFFIAQKADSQPSVTESSISGDWSAVTFSVSSSTGAITLGWTADITVGGIGGHGFTGFTGINSYSNEFDGELALTDEISGSFIFGYSAGDGTMTAEGIDGGFLVSADGTLAVGIDLLSNRYFAVER